MGLHRWWQVTSVIVSLFLSSWVDGSESYYDHESLDYFIIKLANKEIQGIRTGVLYNVPIPSNFTGIEVSVVRLRGSSLWAKGMNYGYFNLPPQTISQPNEKRIAILFENLGNWSSLYYNVPNHTMVAPVFAVLAYSSSKKALVDKKINIITEGDPIRIFFPYIEQHGKNNTPFCAKFSAGGLVRFKNMTKPYVCDVYSQGHYTLVVPSFPSPKEPNNTQSQPDNTQSQPNNTQSHHSKRINTWWVLGFVIGFIGLLVLLLILLTLVKEAKKRRIRKLEKNSEGGELFDTFWIGETKLPLASALRTQPNLEN